MTSSSLTDSKSLLAPIRRLHELIRREVVEACERSAVEDLSAVEREEEGDTIYAVDRVSEDLLVDFFEREVASHAPVVLVAEGLRGGKVVLPRGASEDECAWRVIVDPIDGTRGLMYQKRSGWVLTGAARNRGPETCLADIELAVQTELPLVKQHLCDVAWAVRGEGDIAEVLLDEREFRLHGKLDVGEASLGAAVARRAGQNPAASLLVHQPARAIYRINDDAPRAFVFGRAARQNDLPASQAFGDEHDRRVRRDLALEEVNKQILADAVNRVDCVAFLLALDRRQVLDRRTLARLDDLAANQLV